MCNLKSHGKFGITFTFIVYMIQCQVIPITSIAPQHDNRIIGIENHRLSPKLKDFRPSQPIPSDPEHQPFFKSDLSPVYFHNKTTGASQSQQSSNKISFVFPIDSNKAAKQEQTPEAAHINKNSLKESLNELSLPSNPGNYWAGQSQNLNFQNEGRAWRRDSWNQNNCQNLRSFNPGCCNLGYSNCCGNHNGGGSIFPPPIINPGWSSNQWKGKGHGGGGHGGQYHVRPPPPQIPHFKPHPIPQPVSYPQFGGGGHHEKPGSCHYKSPFSFLSKFNIFSKDKGSLDLKHGSGWGWNPYPPGQSGGYHFFRRSDMQQQYAYSSGNHLNRKRQLDIPAQNQQQQQQQQGFFRDNDNFNKNQDIYNYNNYEQHKNNGPFNNNQQRPLVDNVVDIGNKLEEYYNIENANDGEKRHEESYQSPNYGYGREQVGIGSVTGRVLGGWGWGNGITTGWTVVNPHHPCHTDFQCPGDQKCCDSICKTPSFSTFGR